MANGFRHYNRRMPSFLTSWFYGLLTLIIGYSLIVIYTYWLMPAGISRPSITDMIQANLVLLKFAVIPIIIVSLVIGLIIHGFRLNKYKTGNYWGVR